MSPRSRKGGAKSKGGIASSSSKVASEMVEDLAELDAD